MAELALALLTHWLVSESNHCLVFTEHLSWKAGNPLLSCFAPWPVFLTVVFSFWLSVSFHPLSPHHPLEPKDPKEQVSVPPSHPSQHLPALPRKPSVSTTFLLPLGPCTFFSIYGHSRGVFNGFQGHHARSCFHWCSQDHAQLSSRAHHISWCWCWCRGAHARLWWAGGTTLAATSCRLEPPLH